MAIRFLTITNTFPEVQIKDLAVGATPAKPKLVFYENALVSGGVSTSGGALVFEASSGIERMRITSVGNVGIGDTPSFKLDVNVTSSRARFKATSGDANIELSSIAGHDWLIQSKSDSSLAIYDEDEALERIRITSAGNVGIGTTSPGFKLDVNGNAKVNSNFYIGNVDAVTTATEVLVRQSDRVRGITPANLINASGGPFLPLSAGGSFPLTGDLTISTSSPNLNLLAGADGNSTINFADPDDNNVGQIIYRHAGNNMSFDTNDNERMRITSDGNVGINEINPILGKLQVGGIIHVNRNNTAGTSASPYFENILQSGLNLTNISSIQLGNSFSSDNGTFLRFQVNSAAAASTPINALTLDSSGNATFAGTVSGTTATFTTFSGDLNGTINTATTAVTQANAIDNTTVATTAYVVNKIAELPAGLQFLGTWNADTNTPTLASGGSERSEGTTTTLTANKLIDSSATFTTAPAVVVGDRVRVVTPNGPEFALVTAVDSATQLTLASDIVTATGEAYILEVAPFLPEGSYYIVSTNGATDLNGITDWKVGDWAVASSTNVWQKIDNSSVLDGSGTGGSVTGWSGSGTSNTLTNAPITFSGNNSTFAGNVLLDGYLSATSTTIGTGATRWIGSDGTTSNWFYNVPTGGNHLFGINNSNLLSINSTSETFAGDVIVKSALLSNQENTDIDSAAAEMVAQVAIATYTAAFFDFVVKKSTNVRSGTVYACHDGTNVEFTETSTQDLGDTSDVVLSVDISGTQMRLIATVASDDWSVKSLIRAI